MVPYIVSVYAASSTEYAVVLLFMAITALFTAIVAIYRIYFHPLSRFPGPLLARVSYGYEFWFDVVHKGQFTRKVAQLHELYGPIVRVNPDELHCNDPAFIDILYRTGKEKRDKSSHYLAAFPRGVRLATVGTANHDEHKQRRVPVAKYFSRSRIAKHEDIVHEKAHVLCDRLLAWNKNDPFELTLAYSCFTTDTLTKYAFGHSLENLQRPGWKPTFKGTVDKMTGLFYLSRHLPFLAHLAEYLPLLVSKKNIIILEYADSRRNICRYISTDITALLELIRVIIPKLVLDSVDTEGDKVVHPNIVDALLEADLAPSEKTVERLTGEAVAVVLGGTHSISTVLSIITFHLIRDTKRLDRLRSELRGAVRDERALPRWSTLEQLPFLNAVIQEGLRLMHGVASRITLVAPDEDLVYVASDNSSHVIPRGSSIGVSSYMIHNDSKLYPDPTVFLPERWLDENGTRNRELDKYMMSFSKGPRQCVGMQ
ncbi:hypothetical protein NLG97_g3643 [Lecanicillium saksenae]|uniref:Uncharacterized protein n=1 Tax=Lecanicillium saksenae TaxID=468837 RepID=A0ACC1R0S4_9HYPO|nr:hypothetical protein NLG97_g3643 [Lecanicillium saksenae]